MKECSKCGELKKLSKYHKNNSKFDGHRHMCKKCVNKYKRKHYLNNKEKYKKQARRNRKKNVKKRKEKLYELLQNSECIDCGEDNPIVLEFDHIKGNKKLEVSVMVSTGYSWSAIESEIDKCEIVCSNCHKIRTGVRGNYWRTRYSSK